jgi:multiple sugar transport system substrate-binding protein
MRRYGFIVAALFTIAPLCVQAADLVVWWEEGFYAQEDEAVREIIASFEQDTGKQVELVFYPQAELPGQIEAALEVGQPPDFAFGLWLNTMIGQWAFDDRLAHLADAVGHFSDQFDPVQLDRAFLLNARTGQKALYALPMGKNGNYIHVWKSLLEQAGFTLADVPKEWESFWSFWCDKVQPAVRRATGRNDIWGIGLSMSPDASDPETEFFQFADAYEADYVSRDGRLVIDNPVVRRKLIKTINSYTAIYRKGCTPPESVRWANIDNNKAFLGQAVVMTPNDTLSIPNALKRERPDDYYEHTATIEWPLGPSGELFPIEVSIFQAVAFARASNVAAAKEFVHFLAAEGWLAHYLDFSGERMLPSISKLLESPFWLDPSDRHHMAAVMQAESRPVPYSYTVVSGDWRYDRIASERVWPRAIHRIVTENISPEQAVDEAIARIKQILSE